MRSRTGSAALALGLLLASSPARAADAIEFEAAVDRDRIAIDEVVRLRVTLGMNEGKEPEQLSLPSGDDFEVVSRSRSDQMSFALGGGGPSYRRVRTYDLVLQPRRQGNLTIDAGVAVIGGRRVTTRPIRITVGPPGSGAPRSRGGSPGLPGIGPVPTLPGFPDEDLFGGLFDEPPPPTERDVFLRVSADPPDPHVGQQVTLTVYLASQRHIASVQNPEYPQLDAFWAEELDSPTRLDPQIKVIDGREYQVSLLRRRAVFPLQAGDVTLPPVRMKLAVGGSFFSPGRQVERESPPITLHVRPLPEGAPPGFQPGNVGQLGIRAEVSPRTVNVGDAITVRITVAGQGNLRQLEVPDLPPVDGFRSFDPTHTDELGDQGDHRWGGSRTLEHVLVAEQPGTYTLPAIQLAYFDPDTNAYATAATQPLTVTVRGSAASAANPRAGVAPPATTDRGAGLRPLRAAPVITAGGPSLPSRPWFVAALVAPALLVAGTMLVPRLRDLRSRGEGQRRVRGAGKVARRRLGAAGALAASRDVEFWAELSRALHEYLALKLGRPTVGLTREDLLAALRGAGAQAPTIAAVGAALDACDLGRFVPGALDPRAAEAALAQASTAIDDLEDLHIGAAA